MKDIYGTRYCPHYVGEIVEFGANVDPNTLYPSTKWSRYGNGRVTVGIDSTDASFDTINEVGGAKTFNNAHYHGQGDLEAMIGSTNNNVGAIGFQASNKHAVGAYGNATYTITGGSGSNQSFNHFTRVVGITDTTQSTAQSLLQPYAVVSRWIRNS